MLTNTKVKVTKDGFQLNALIYTPNSYDASKKYPLIIFAHGKGEAGIDINTLFGAGLPKVLQSGFIPPIDCIIVCPQATSYGVNPAWLPFIVADIQTRYSVDKIFITGLSAGGWACYGSQFNVSADFGKLFSGIIVLSGATQDIIKTNLDWIIGTKVPVVAIVGANDTSYVDQNKYMVSEINKRVSNIAEFYSRSGYGHNGWESIYDGTYKMPDGTNIWDRLKNWIGTVIQPTPDPVTPKVLFTLSINNTSYTIYDNNTWK